MIFVIQTLVISIFISVLSTANATTIFQSSFGKFIGEKTHYGEMTIKQESFLSFENLDISLKGKLKLSDNPGINGFFPENQKKNPEKMELGISRLSLSGSWRELRWETGKIQPLSNEDKLIHFDSNDLNPFSRKDLRSPFRSLEEENELGSWGAVGKLSWGNFQFTGIIARWEDPIIARNKADPWSRETPFNLCYGVSENESDLNWGFRLAWLGSFLLEGTLFSGSANAPSGIEIANEIDFVFPKQQSVSLAAEFYDFFGGFTFRTGTSFASREWQGEKAGEILTATVEADWVKEFSGGKNLYIGFGLNNTWATKTSLVNNPGIDLNQIHKGGSLFLTTEVENDWGLGKFRGLMNPTQKGKYLSVEFKQKSLLPTLGELLQTELLREATLGIRAEIVRGNENKAKDAPNYFSDFDGNNQVTIEISIPF